MPGQAQLQGTAAPTPIPIGEEWPPPAERWLDLVNPATGGPLGRLPLGGAAAVDAAVTAATAGFVRWSAEPMAQRMTVLFRYRELLSTHAEELARLIARENGKTLDEARGDLRR